MGNENNSVIAMSVSEEATDAAEREQSRTCSDYAEPQGGKRAKRS